MAPIKLFIVLACLVSCVVLDGTTFKIGMVQDQQERYAPDDKDIYLGVAWFAQWANARGGIQYVIFLLHTL